MTAKSTTKISTPQNIITRHTVIVATMEGEGVEQLQPTALDSEETTTTGTCAKGHVMVYMHVMTIPTCVFT